jgi:DNA-binding response OmpR family regulator
VTASTSSSGAHDGPTSILVVDDHEEIAHLLAMLLSANGYSVVEARSVAEAVDRYTAEGPQHLVITDIGLADGNGADLVAQLAHPMARTLFTSGHPRTAFDGTAAALPPDAVFVQKPCAPAVLLAMVRELLASTDQPRIT